MRRFKAKRKKAMGRLAFTGREIDGVELRTAARQADVRVVSAEEFPSLFDAWPLRGATYALVPTRSCATRTLRETQSGGEEFPASSAPLIPDPQGWGNPHAIALITRGPDGSWSATTRVPIFPLSVPGGAVFGLVCFFLGLYYLTGAHRQLGEGIAGIAAGLIVALILVIGFHRWRCSRQEEAQRCEQVLIAVGMERVS